MHKYVIEVSEKSGRPDWFTIRSAQHGDALRFNLLAFDSDGSECEFESLTPVKIDGLMPIEQPFVPGVLQYPKYRIPAKEVQFVFPPG